MNSLNDDVHVHSKTIYLLNSGVTSLFFFLLICIIITNNFVICFIHFSLIIKMMLLFTQDPVHMFDPILRTGTVNRKNMPATIWTAPTLIYSTLHSRCMAVHAWIQLKHIKSSIWFYFFTTSHPYCLMWFLKIKNSNLVIFLSSMFIYVMTVPKL